MRIKIGKKILGSRNMQEKLETNNSSNHLLWETFFLNNYLNVYLDYLREVVTC